ncbi:MAG TPA: histidine kinase, partial [Nocardioidaceae bacterium]|nr:histidine kinase [Nocardioidaceae bacterium]
MAITLDRLNTTRVDAALAVAFTVVGLIQVVLAPIAAPGLGELFVVGSTLPLAWRRTRPIEASLISAAFWLIPLDGFPILGFVVVILQFFALGSWGAPRLAVALVTAWATATAVIGTLLGPEPPVAIIGGVLVVVAPVLAGQLVRHLRHQNHALADLAEQLQDEQRRVEEAAVDAERARIAQELHDVVGHEVTLIAIQAEAAASALKTSPERAGAPVEAIRATAHRTLTEIRGVLGLLAPDGDTGGTTAEGLTELARRAEVAGITNSLVVTGEPWPDSAPAGLAVNRIVRECLTNAGRHAPGEPVTLNVAWSPEQVQVRATNPTDSRRRPTP